MLGNEGVFPSSKSPYGRALAIKPSKSARGPRPARGGRELIIRRLEEGSDLFPKALYLERFTPILRIEMADVVQAMSLDYDEYEKWCDTPVQPYLVLRAVPGFYLNQSLPEGC